MIKLNYPKFWQSRSSILTKLLLPLSFIYRFLGKIRSITATKNKISTPVICVGNISVGGTGKTQVVRFLAEYFSSKGIRFCIISKGYGGSFRGTYLLPKGEENYREYGDEAIELNIKYPVIVCKDFKALNNIISENRFELVILDDFMQNPYIHKDITIAIIDGLRGIGNGNFFPAGPLREDLKTLNEKADFTIIIGEDNSNIAKQVFLPTFKAQITHKGTYKIGEYLAFTGIGNPEKFFKTLKSAQISVKLFKTFPDHYIYKTKDIESLIFTAKKENLLLITTLKDYVKIPLEYKENFCYLDVELQIDKEFVNSLSDRLKNYRLA